MKSPNRLVSQAALRFLEEAQPLEQLRLDNIVERRAEQHEETLATNPPIIADCVARIENREIGGVPALLLTPKNYDTANDDRCVLYFFGGAFVVGSPEVDLPIIARLTTRLGVKIVAPYYRLAPEHACPAAIDDGIAVYRELLQTFAAGNIAVTGESAGGNLALAVTLRAREFGDAMPAALALLSPWSDVTPTGESQQQPEGFDPTLDYEKYLREPAAAYAGNYDEKDPRVSPLCATFTPDFPPTIITTGVRDLLLSDCQRLAEKFRQANIDVQLRVWEGMWHVFEWYADIPEADLSMDEIADFIRQRFAV
jgi:monoterpene epsilon-lactone hydrolase